MHSLFTAKDKRRTKTKGNGEKRNARQPVFVWICVRVGTSVFAQIGSVHSVIFLLHLLAILTSRTVIPVVFLSPF